MPSLLVLLVLLGASSGLPALGRSFLSQQLMQDTESLAQVLKLTKPGVVTRPLFSQVQHILNSSCPRADTTRLLNATLDVYAGVFSNVLQQHSDLLLSVPESRRQQVEQTLQRLHQRMQTLRKSLSHTSHQRALENLRALQVGDADVQRRALAEFKEVYQVVSLIGHKCGHARPSSAQR